MWSKIRNSPKLQRLAAILISVSLLAADSIYRSYVRLTRWLFPLLPDASRLFAIGVLSSGALLGILAMSAYSAKLVPETNWTTVAFVWGLAMLMLAVDALAFMLLHSVASFFAGILYRLTDMSSRQMTAPETMPGIRPNGKPQFREPGKLKEEPKPSSGGGEFIGYDEETAYIQSLREELAGNGMDQETINEALEGLQAERRRNASGQ